MAGPPVALTGANSATASFIGANPGGTHTFRVTVTDGNGYEVTDTASVRSNNPPTMNPLPAQSVMQGRSLSFTVRATDPENDALTYVTIDPPPAGSTFAAATGQFSWPNVAAAPGAYSFRVMASDGTVNSQPINVSITVTSPPPPPASGGGGGGGTLPPADIAALALLAALAWRRRRGCNADPGAR